MEVVARDEYAVACLQSNIFHEVSVPVRELARPFQIRGIRLIKEIDWRCHHLSKLVLGFVEDRTLCISSRNLLSKDVGYKLDLHPAVDRAHDLLVF